MSSQGFGPGSPKSFRYPRGDFNLESGIPCKGRKPKNSHLDAPGLLNSALMKIRYFYEAHPVAVALILLSFGLSVLILLSVYETRFRMMRSGNAWSNEVGAYTFPNLRSLVMVAGHSIYTSESCGKIDREDAWFLEPYQKHPGQAATFLAHIKEGVEIAARDEGALLLFSGGETRKDAGPRSEAQSYWAIAESKGWFGKDESVRSRALTEEHARDSFENLLFSVCRFRELTGTYPQNITALMISLSSTQWTFQCTNSTVRSSRISVLGMYREKKMEFCFRDTMAKKSTINRIVLQPETVRSPRRGGWKASIVVVWKPKTGQISPYLSIPLIHSHAMAADILFLCTGLRPVVLMDYGGTMPQLQKNLCTLPASRSAAAFKRRREWHCAGACIYPKSVFSQIAC